MDIKRSLIAALIAATAIAAPAPSLAEGINVERFGLYVLADDVDALTKFYEALFGNAPQIKTPALTGFVVSGGLFGIVLRKAYAPNEPRAGSVRPYMRVADLNEAFARVNHLVPERIEGGRIVQEGPFRFFRFADPSGNIVELFAIDPLAAKP